MGAIKKIIKLSKGLALDLLNEKKIDSSEIGSLFTHEDTKDILKNVTNVKDKKEREDLAKIINKTKNEDWIKVKSKITYNKNKKLFTFVRIAAMLIICLGLTYFYVNKNNDNSVFSSEKNIVTLPHNNDHIVLELDNGNKEIITENGTKSILDKSGKLVGVQNGTKLNYKNSNKEKTSEKLVYNQLTIPYGKIFQVVLSDGTKVYLNAGSSLRYPVNFIKGKNRIVFLKGEAYFDVEKNPKQPFIVNTDDMQIEVLGTKFNVSSYPEDSNINTVLLEGSVSINSNNNNNNNTFKSKKTLLKPGRKAKWGKLDGAIKIKTVDTSLYTAWIEGRIVFKHMPFKNILKKLERHYNVSITNNNVQLAKEEFTASFDIETIEQVLNSFSKNVKFNYSINNNHITIN